MREYKISSFADLVQALKEDPEWLEELRRMILTEELLELPKRFGEFRCRVEERFNALEKQVQELKEEFDKDMRDLKGMWLEMKERRLSS